MDSMLKYVLMLKYVASVMILLILSYVSYSYGLSEGKGEIIRNLRNSKNFIYKDVEYTGNIKVINYLKYGTGK